MRACAVVLGLCAVGVAASAWAVESRYAPDGALGARWVEVETGAGVLVAQTTEVTRGQWRAVMGQGPGGEVGCLDEDCPATDVTPLSMMVFANRLSDLEGFDRCYDIVGGEGDVSVGRLVDPVAVSIHGDCRGYRLPTHDEWSALLHTEPYARPGVPLGWLERVGWVRAGTVDDDAKPVARKWPSDAGLYDLVGNVVEVAVLPEPVLDVAILDRTLMPASLVMLGCAIGSADRCSRSDSPMPTFLKWAGPQVGFRLVRAY